MPGVLFVVYTVIVLDFIYAVPTKDIIEISLMHLVC